MQKLKFEIDWVDAERINGPELSATWASLRIYAGDSVITRVLDARAKTVRDFVYVPLYPLAEWLATNWWFLTQEINNPEKEDDPDFHRRHALSASREGYAFPDLEVFSAGGRTRLAWKQGIPPWTKVEFLGQGEIQIDSSEFRDTCVDVVDQVVRRLVSFDIEETFLQEEWAAIQAADKDESEFCEIAAGLGLDPYALDDAKRALVLELAEELSGAVLEEAVAALDPQTLRVGCSTITGAIAGAKSNGLRLERFESIHQKVCPDKGSAGLQPWKDDQSPAFGFRQLGEHSKRFHFCRALAEALVSPNTNTLLTRANSERQQRNRTFAAEFLAPSSGLQERISGQTVDGDQIDELADEFGVSSLVIEHQVQNHRIARVCR